MRLFVTTPTPFGGCRSCFRMARVAEVALGMAKEMVELAPVLEEAVVVARPVRT
jgi:hypothetical protein